jgi:MFS family permease
LPGGDRPLSKVFLFSLTAALNPTLLAATTVMLLLPRPKRLLLGYLLGAYTTSITVGLAIEYWLHGSGTITTTKNTVSPVIDITLGVLALLVAFVIGTGRLADRRNRKQTDKPKKTPRWQRTLSKGSARDTFIVGLLLSFPGASYLAALDQIYKQNLSAAAVVLTVVAVTVIMLILLELPLIGYALAPEWTPNAVERLKTWLGRNGGRAAVIGATLIGIALIVRGTIELLP